MMRDEHVDALLFEFLQNQLRAAGSSGVVLGLSGGLDSTVVAFLATRSLGADNVLALILPEGGVTPEEDLEDARMVAMQLGIEHKEIDISSVLEGYSQVLPLKEAPRLINGNLKARIRMTLIYWHANLLNRMVLGTGNKTEIMLGYCTKYGDAAADVLPLAGLYKDQVRRLGENLGVPRRILDKTPTAGLWPGQTDEDELGITYFEANEILRDLERGFDEAMLKDKYDEHRVELVLNRVKGSEHKRVMPPWPKI